MKTNISAAMVAAGVKTLRDSGVPASDSSADSVVVQRILESSLAVREREVARARRRIDKAVRQRVEEYMRNALPHFTA